MIHIYIHIYINTFWFLVVGASFLTANVVGIKPEGAKQGIRERLCGGDPRGGNDPFPCPGHCLSHTRGLQELLHIRGSLQTAESLSV